MSTQPDTFRIPGTRGSIDYLRLPSNVSVLARNAVESVRAQARGRLGHEAGVDDAAVGGRPPATGATDDAVASFPDLDVRFEREAGIYWQMMQPRGRPSYTMGLLGAMKRSLEQAQAICRSGNARLNYLVTGSRLPGIYNLGGDLPHFATLIERGDRETLRRYAHACIDVQYLRAAKAHQPYVAISLVQGDALGGGFECALADDVIIAERGTKFGLPEVLFGLFPGMGAYSFLSRKIGDALAERMMVSGKVYTAEDLHEIGLVAMLAEPGEGEAAVRRFIKADQRAFRARTALSRIRQRVEPVTRRELLEITDTWVDAALTLDSGDLRKMRRLAAAQDRRWAEITPARQAAPLAAEA
jgi:DSF synthase